MTVSVAREERKWFQNRLIEWGRANFQEFIWRRIRSPIHQLIVEVLLQRTKAEQVEPVFKHLLEQYPTLTDLSRLTEGQLSAILRTLGLFRRATLIVRLLELLQTKYRGMIPEDYSELLDLPGVGPYSASAFLSLHRNQRHAIIDSNVVKLYGRFFGFEYDGETRRKAWLKRLADSLTPQRRFKDYNYAILDFSRLICQRKPLCPICPLQRRCSFYKVRNKK